MAGACLDCMRLDHELLQELEVRAAGSVFLQSLAARSAALSTEVSKVVMRMLQETAFTTVPAECLALLQRYIPRFWPDKGGGRLLPAVAEQREWARWQHHQPRRQAPGARRCVALLRQVQCARPAQPAGGVQRSASAEHSASEMPARDVHACWAQAQGGSWHPKDSNVAIIQRQVRQHLVF